jgi:hypothetical protein
MWIELAPKTLPKRALCASDTPLTERALARRAKFRTDGKLIDARDVPIAAPRIDAIRATGVRVRAESRWLNAVSVEGTREQLDQIAALPFVRSIRPLHPSRRVAPVDVVDEEHFPEGSIAAINYGFMSDQLTQITVPSMHVRGFHGEGMVIGVLDTGFHRVHQAFQSTEYPLDVIAEWDFVSNDANTGIDVGDHAEQHKHGTWILGTLAAYLPGTAVGSAYAAQFILAKTEDYANEVPIEEDYYVAGLEFIEGNGADLATSSLGYIDWYTPEDLDGVTAVTTQAVNIATANGLVCLTAAGNAGHDTDPATNRIIAPADAFDVITCGAAHASGAIAGFSSDGPSADGRVKPEVLARGVSVVSVHSTNATGLQSVSGTSLSTPLIAGATALLMQARAELSVAGVRDALISTASRSVAGTGADPLFIEGFGMISTRAAAMKDRAAEDINLDGAITAADLSLLLASWGPCADPDPATGRCAADFDGDGLVGASDLARVLDAWGK